MMEISKICTSCFEPLSPHNIATEAGKEEVEITGMCEVCFDYSTFALGENGGELDDVVLDLVRKFDGLVLAGGCFRKLVDPNDEIVDYDLFLLDWPHKAVTKKNVLAELHGLYTKIFECPAGKLFSFKDKDTGIKVQLIDFGEYRTLEELVDSFDITACCAGLDKSGIYMKRRFVFDVLNKRINLNKVAYPIATMKRIAKYIEKGYKMSPACAMEFVSRVNEIELTEDNMFVYVD